MDVETLQLDRRDWVPNNPALPVLFYRGALGDGGAGDAEALFARNGWPPRWRDGIFAWHHYHSTAHEVLGIVGGRARVILGGPGGAAVDLASGDVVALPAGTGHCRVEASDDFLVVGAYPGAEDVDLRREAPTEEMVRRIADLPVPSCDPVEGRDGPMARLWGGA